MEMRRKTDRITIETIPEVLHRPQLIYNDTEISSEIENLSPLGVGLVTAKNISITTGDIFYLRYAVIDSDIKCLCVYSIEDEKRISIGAYFSDPEDQKKILRHLYF